MNSQFLIESGFKKFGEFIFDDIKNRQSELNLTGVYAFVLDEEFPRLRGRTDIIYIGHAGSRNKRSIHKRMLDYCKAYKSAPQDKRISDQIKRLKTKVRVGTTLRDKILNNRVSLFYKEIQHDECRKAEFNLLKQYSEDHIELPPLNRSN
jgi:hypothetical protein